MKRMPLTYWIQFYFWAVVFFIEAVFYLIKKPKPAPIVAVVPTGINLLDEEAGVLAKKPSQAAAMKNKAFLGMAAMPKEHKKKIITGIILSVWFYLSGIGSTIYWMTLLIKKYNMVGWILLYAFISWMAYLLLEFIYNYVKNKKHQIVLLKVQTLWNQATLKADRKLQPQIA